MKGNQGILNLKIITLGNFDIRNGQKSLLENVSKRSYRVFDLLKLFVTFKDKKLLPETILERLLPENELQDPKNALRTQIYRLRKMLTEMEIVDEQDDCGFCQLNFQNGFYVFTLTPNCSLDVEEFGRYIQQGNELKDCDPPQAMLCYQQALKLYKGEYLSENLYNEWIIPVRNRYHRLYSQALLQQLELLKNESNYQSIVETCEEAFQIDPYEESVHIFYLDALIKLAQIKQATSHYHYITTKLFQELGVKPSPLLREIYREIKHKTMQKKDMNFWDILRDLKEDENTETAFYCEMDEFRAIYNLERRKSIRYPSTSFLGLVSLPKDEEKKEHREVKNTMQKLKNILLVSLRKGDVVTQWNEDTIMFIVTSTSEDNLGFISRRIENNFYRENSEDGFLVKINFQPISEKKSFIM